LQVLNDRRQCPDEGGEVRCGRFGHGGGGSE
jgi:hypothetical protein